MDAVAAGGEQAAVAAGAGSEFEQIRAGNTVPLEQLIHIGRFSVRIFLLVEEDVVAAGELEGLAHGLITA